MKFEQLTMNLPTAKEEYAATCLLVAAEQIPDCESCAVYLRGCVGYEPADKCLSKFVPHYWQKFADEYDNLPTGELINNGEYTQEM